MKSNFTIIAILLLVLSDVWLADFVSDSLKEKEKDLVVRKRRRMYFSDKIVLNPKLAWQSSTWGVFSADKALIYNCAKEEWSQASATKDRQYHPAWAIDLRRLHMVKQTVVTAAKLQPDAKAFNEAHVFVLLKRPNLKTIFQFSKNCSYFKGPAKALQKIRFVCHKLGRFVAIGLKQDVGVLELCHVSIYGDLPDRINGAWTMWSEWTSCSRTCNKGQKRKTRSCTNPIPQFGGHPCVGKRMDSVPCQVAVCPASAFYMNSRKLTAVIILVLFLCSICGVIVVYIILNRRKKKIAEAEMQFQFDE